MSKIEAIQLGALRRDLPPFRPGDTLRVHVRIREGDKERIQVFEGVCIRRRGRRRSETFTVRKVSYGVGVERIFPVESPAVTKVEIKSRGHVRRARLYYLRELRGKKARLRSKVRDLSALLAPQEAEGPGTAEEAEVQEAVAAEQAEVQEAVAAEAGAEPGDEAPAESPEAAAEPVEAAAGETPKDA